MLFLETKSSERINIAPNAVKVISWQSIKTGVHAENADIWRNRLKLL